AVHARADADIMHVALTLGLRDACDQDTRLSDHIPSGLEPHLACAAGPLDLRKPAIEGREIERTLPGALRHAEAAAEIEITDLREPLEQLDELLPRVAPRLGREHAAAGMRMQPNDFHVRGPHALLELGDLDER